MRYYRNYLNKKPLSPANDAQKSLDSATDQVSYLQPPPKPGAFRPKKSENKRKSQALDRTRREKGLFWRRLHRCLSAHPSVERGQRGMNTRGVYKYSRRSDASGVRIKVIGLPSERRMATSYIVAARLAHAAACSLRYEPECCHQSPWEIFRHSASSRSKDSFF